MSRAEPDVGPRRRNLVALGIALFLSGLVSVNILVPAYIRSLGGTMFFLGVFYSLMGLAGLLSRIPSGYYSDRVGRRPMLSLSGLLKALGSLILALSTRMFEVVSALFLRGIGASVGGAASLAMISDSAGRRRAGLVFGITLSVVGLAGVVGPILTGIVAEAHGFRGAFALSFALTIASVLILLLGLTETKAPTLRGGGKGLLDLGILGILRGNRDLLIVFISYFFYIGAMSCRLPFFAIYVSEELGLSYVELGFIVGAGGLLALFSRVSSGLLADRLGGKRVLVVAGLVRASAFLLIPFARDLVHLVGVYLLFSIFMCGPPRNALISKITRASTRGEVFGAIGAFGDVARTLIPIPIGLIAQNLSLRASFGTLATLTIAYVAIVSLIREPREPR